LEKDERHKEFIAAQKAFKLPKQIGIKITGGANLNGGKLKGVAGSGAGAGIDLKEFLKFATAAMAKKHAGGASPGGARPPASSEAAVAKQAAPSSVGVSSAQALVPGPLGGGPVASPPSVEEKISDDYAEQAREAEIEAILEGGAPYSPEMKELLKPIPQIKDEDIPF
jgi:hypothetical protein